ncbi:MAG: branched-chain amino acid aminotransferase [Arenicellales bacterium]|nr:branched-chain amino acid aminotransferase [Arenicellales bacterium]
MKINLDQITHSSVHRMSEERLVFGNIFSDHMLVRQFENGNWGDANIVPRAPMQIDPTTLALHYGQAVFEGLKAYRNTDDQSIQLFRPEENGRRLIDSCERLAIPNIPVDEFVACVRALVEVEKNWVPLEKGEALYIRPLIFASEQHIAVRAATTYTFVIMAGPAEPYFASGRSKLRLKAEGRYTRAAAGGTGAAKTSGNYAGTLKPMAEAVTEGFDQILWLDGQTHRFAEEAGQMNVFFRIGDEVVTPELSGTILPGVTRDTVIQLLSDWGYTVSTRQVSIQELKSASDAGLLIEMFGAGTAAVIAPIQSITFHEEELRVNVNSESELSKRLLDTILGIQHGTLADTHGWTVKI